MAPAWLCCLICPTRSILALLAHVLRAGIGKFGLILPCFVFKLETRLAILVIPLFPGELFLGILARDQRPAVGASGALGVPS